MEKKQPLKKFFILMAIWLVTILSVFAGSVLYDRYQASGYDTAATPYIEKIIPILSQWDPVTARALMSPEVAQSIPEPNFIEAMALFSRLGSLQSMEGPEFDRAHEDQSTPLGQQTIIVYNVKAKYEKGDAVINLNLIERAGVYEIYRFNFSSQILLDQK